MGIFDSIGNIVRGQLIDVIEWTDSTNNTIVHKYDMNGKEIMMGAQLTVRESQVAIFVNEGKLADVFQPGRYELSPRQYAGDDGAEGVEVRVQQPVQVRRVLCEHQAVP